MMKKVPKRRFKGFLNAGDWEQRKLGEIASINPRTELPNSFKYVDLESVIGTNLIGCKKIEKENAPSRAQRLASFGDIFYQTVRPYQRNNYLFEKDDDDVVFSTGYAQLRSELDSYFLFTLIQTDSFVRKVLDNCTGTSYPAINSSELGKILISVPQDKLESHQIGTIFRVLDNVITLHQRKLEKLQATKKALLYELFPIENSRKPKRRFKGFTGDWEQRKLISCIQKVIDFRGRTPNKLGMEWSCSGHLALSALNVKDGYIDFSQDNHYGDNDLYEKWMTGNELHKGQVVFTTEAPMGNVAQIPDNERYILSQRTVAFCVDENIITENFLAVLLRTPVVFKTLTKLSSGGTAQGISQKSLAEIEVRIPPNLHEQQIISNFLLSFEHCITLHQRKLEKLKNLKAAYLNEMFV